ncbi:uncharacterized protein [Anser cygnoides]|uniref:uncharacterized protein n=1 Tax=Anser cygnoides TaxID=8845 RepID=UPI0006709B84
MFSRSSHYGEMCFFLIVIISDEKITEIPGILEGSFCQHSLLFVQLFLKQLNCTESSTLPRKTQPIPQRGFLEEEPGEGWLRKYRGTQKQQGTARKTRGDKAGRLHTMTWGLSWQHACWEGEYVLDNAADVDMLVYQLFLLPVLKFFKAESITKPKPYRCGRLFKDPPDVFYYKTAQRTVSNMESVSVSSITLCLAVCGFIVTHRDLHR